MSSQVAREIREELNRIAHAWGATESCWATAYENGEWVGRAYIGQRALMVAMVGHSAQQVAMGLLRDSLRRVDGT